MRQLARVLSVLVVFAGFGVASVWGGEPQKAGPVKSITLTTEEFGDLEQVLNIKKAAGAYELASKASRHRLRFEFYHKGQKHKDDALGGGIQIPAAEATGWGKYWVRLIDLDYLPLGGAKPGHTRVHLQFLVGGQTMRTSFDVPKTLFNVSDVNSIQVFRPSVAIQGKVPLFCMLANTSTVRGGGLTPADVVQMNPEADVLVAILEFE